MLLRRIKLAQTGTALLHKILPLEQSTESPHNNNKTVKSIVNEAPEKEAASVTVTAAASAGGSVKNVKPASNTPAPSALNSTTTLPTKTSNAPTNNLAAATGEPTPPLELPAAAATPAVAAGAAAPTVGATATAAAAKGLAATTSGAADVVKE